LVSERFLVVRSTTVAPITHDGRQPTGSCAADGSVVSKGAGACYHVEEAAAPAACACMVLLVGKIGNLPDLVLRFYYKHPLRYRTSTITAAVLRCGLPAVSAPTSLDAAKL
jgi:hypothetical protein